DWVASGRLYRPIEDTITKTIGPMVANTHSFSSETGKASTYAYHHARKIIKQHVNATEDDVLIATGTGMTSLLAKLQRIMGLRISSDADQKGKIPEKERPVVFISHMEHHSNQVSWMETIADVVVVPCNGEQLVCPDNLEKELEKYSDRTLKIGAFTACSNVTGIIAPYHELAKVMHKHNGYCVIDFAASAPYVDIDMHPEEEAGHLDAILFSPHKFLGGPGSCGVLVFNKALYKAEIPDVPGGGNVKWTNPWGEYAYCDDIETKEDGGTPGFLQVMRAAMAIRLKEKMGTDNIEQREKELLNLCFSELQSIPGLFILGSTDEKRIGCVSFGVQGIHYNLMVRLLNDRFGIQVRGGWSCASTYGHHLFDIDRKKSETITQGIANKNLTEKPGWVRLSLHPVTTNEELHFICNAIEQVVENITDWEKEYRYNCKTNEFEHIWSSDDNLIKQVEGWFGK
ncbi:MULTISPECIES: aminotransferase class V-fold PLP-dependent enzyme, partial [Flavobacteriaceae]|uniref:aminotransferase class V-fold PLP-dependent enzyme n=1 Tax=Flavobacteriaceae TaxID=49546 RepID=UPI001491349D